MEVKIIVREQIMADIIAERDAMVLDLNQQLLASKDQCDKLAKEIEELTPKKEE